MKRYKRPRRPEEIVQIGVQISREFRDAGAISNIPEMIGCLVATDDVKNGDQNSLFCFSRITNCLALIFINSETNAHTAIHLSPSLAKLRVFDGVGGGHTSPFMGLPAGKYNVIQVRRDVVRYSTDFMKSRAWSGVGEGVTINKRTDIIAESHFNRCEPIVLYDAKRKDLFICNWSRWYDKYTMRSDLKFPLVEQINSDIPEQRPYLIPPVNVEYPLHLG